MIDGYYYILEGRIPKEVPFEEWRSWHARNFLQRVVAKTELPDGVTVSTVFLTLNHNFARQGPPILFETMIFGGEHDGYQERYSTWEEAEEGHSRAIDLIFEVNIDTWKQQE